MGLVGLDRLYCFMITQDLQELIRYLERTVSKDRTCQDLYTLAQNQLYPLDKLASHPQRTYMSMIQSGGRVWQPLLQAVLRIGQMQLIRRLIAHELATSSKFDSKFLASALTNLNLALLNDIQQHYQEPTKPYPNEENPLMFELTSYLESSGISNPLDKIYITTKSIPNLALTTFMMVITQLNKLQYTKSAGVLMSKRPADGIDGTPLTVGCLSLLKQFNVQQTDVFLQLMAQYIKSLTLETTNNPKATDIPVEAVYAMLFLDDYINFARLPRKTVEAIVPAYMLDEYREKLK